MNPITWVFGGTGVGKKEFIRRVCSKEFSIVPDYPYEPYWIENGWITFEELVSFSETHYPLIRWQWGRSKYLYKIAKDYPEVTQFIYFLRANGEIQKERLIKREGSCDWSAQLLWGCSRETELLVEEIKVRYGINYRVVDVNIDGGWVLL